MKGAAHKTERPKFVGFLPPEKSELSLTSTRFGPDPRLIALVHLLARQAARDYVNEVTREQKPRCS